MILVTDQLIPDAPDDRRPGEAGFAEQAWNFMYTWSPSDSGGAENGFPNSSLLYEGPDSLRSDPGHQTTTYYFSGSGYFNENLENINRKL